MAYNDPGNLFFPSNGTEGCQFEAVNCDRCYKFRQCSIYTGAISGARKPAQWVYDENRHPVCTSLQVARPPRKRKPKPVAVGQLEIAV